MTSIANIIIATHDGVFHGDDVLAVAILSKIYKGSEIIRTRDAVEIENATFAVDVGDVYDHDRRRYDHHQQNGPTDIDDYPYSSAGLIWKHYGLKYLNAINIPKEITLNGSQIMLTDDVAMILLNRWIRPIDLSDNGYTAEPTVISEVVKSFRPVNFEMTRERCDEQFLKTVEVVGEMFERACFHTVDLVISRHDFLSSPRVGYSGNRIFYSDHPVPNMQLMSTSIVDFVITKRKLYVNEDDVRYIITPVRKPPSDRSVGRYKVPFPTAWCGRSKRDLEELTQISEIEFIHHTGFMAVTHTREAAIALCEKLLPKLSR